MCMALLLPAAQAKPAVPAQERPAVATRSALACLPPNFVYACVRLSLQDEFDFGPVYLGTLGRLPLTLVNTTSVPAKMRVDLVS